MVLESLKQPVINGYLIAGSLVGPGGLKLVKVCARAHGADCTVCHTTLPINSQPAAVHHVRCQSASTATHATSRNRLIMTLSPHRNSGKLRRSWCNQRSCIEPLLKLS